MAKGQTVCFTTEIAGFKIELLQEDAHTFLVTYGCQLDMCYSYDDAAKNLGRCIMHALQLEDKIISDD